MASIAENQQTAAVASTVNPMNLVTASEDVISSTLTVQGTVDRLNMSCQLNSGVHVMSSIKAIAEVPTGNGGGEKRQDIELALVIDKSGSMHGEKINSVRETLLLLQKQMGGQDSVSLVTFDTQVKCVMPLTKLKGSLEKERFKRCVEKISSGSSTNLSGGLAEGIKQLKQSKAKNAVRAVILLTDGHANHGISDMDKLARITATDMAGTGISLFTYGYGANHNADALRKLALSTDGGQYYFIEKVDDVGEAIGDCLGGIMSVVAQNIVLKATACPGVKITKLHEPTRKAKVIVPNSCYEIRFGDMYSEERRDTIFEVECDPAHRAQKGQALVKFEIEYLDAVAEKTSTASGKAIIDRVEDAQLNPKLVPDVVDHVCRTRVAETMISANNLADAGQLDQAKQQMNEVLNLCVKMKPMCMNKDLLDELVSDIKEGLVAMTDRQAWRSVRSYAMKGKMMGHAKQRSCTSSATQKTSYRTARKGSMSSKLSVKKW
eukprot:g3260.t1